MDAMGMVGDFETLKRYFTEKLLNITALSQATQVFWEHVFDSGIQIPDDAIIQVSSGGYSALRSITATGRRAILSSCYDLTQLSRGGDWLKFYICDPQDFGGSDDQFNLILGGEAIIWSEYVNRQNVLPRIWPRASAIAEKLWSAHAADLVEYAERRMEEHTCRMNRRDIPAQPANGPGYCVIE